MTTNEPDFLRAKLQEAHDEARRQGDTIATLHAQLAEARLENARLRAAAAEVGPDEGASSVDVDRVRDAWLGWSTLQEREGKLGATDKQAFYAGFDAADIYFPKPTEAAPKGGTPEPDPCDWCQGSRRVAHYEDGVRRDTEPCIKCAPEPPALVPPAYVPKEGDPVVVTLRGKVGGLGAGSEPVLVDVERPGGSLALWLSPTEVRPTSDEPGEAK